MSMINNKELQQYIEVWEQFLSELDDVKAQLKEHKQAGKSAGWDNKICAKIIKNRARDRAAVEEEKTLLEIYEAALNGEEVEE